MSITGAATVTSCTTTANTACTGSGRRQTEGSFGLRLARRFGCMRRLGRFHRLVDASRQSLQLAVLAVEAVDDLQKDLVLMHEVVHQRLELFFGFDVELELVPRADPVA